MISSYMVGVTAGAAAHAKTPRCSEEEVRRMAQETLVLRNRQGVAHLVPWSEFLRGFVDGYKSQVPSIDGLQMFSDEQLKKIV